MAKSSLPKDNEPLAEISAFRPLQLLQALRKSPHHKWVSVDSVWHGLREGAYATGGELLEDLEAKLGDVECSGGARAGAAAALRALYLGGATKLCMGVSTRLVYRDRVKALRCPQHQHDDASSRKRLRTEASASSSTRGATSCSGDDGALSSSSRISLPQYLRPGRVVEARSLSPRLHYRCQQQALSCLAHPHRIAAGDTA